MWAKLDEQSGAAYPLICHLLDSSASAFVVWDRWLRPGLRDLLSESLGGGDPRVARGIYAAIAGIHDIGKANPLFQSQAWADTPASALVKRGNDRLRSDGFSFELPHLTEGRPLRCTDSAAQVLRRHEAVGLLSVAELWPVADDTVAELWAALTVGGHHGRFHPVEPSEFLDDRSQRTVVRLLTELSSGRWVQEQHALIEVVLTATGVTREQVTTPPAGSAGVAVMLLTGMVILADWLASEEAAVDAGMSLSAELSASHAPGEWVAARVPWFEERIEHTVGIYRDLGDSIGAILGDHADAPSDLQRDAQSAGDGLWIAAVPTGEGKTEAALLRHATRADEGLIFALPTRATTEALWDRIARTYSGSGNAAALVHAFAEVHPFYSGDSTHGLHQNLWHDRRATRLFAPVSVGTCDQVLLGSLRQKGLALRLLALSNKHVVLDEVHTYDPYQSALLERLLSWWGETKTRVTLLSASIPTPQRERLMRAYSPLAPTVPATYPAHFGATANQSTVSEVGVRREYTVRFRLHPSSEQSYIGDQRARALGYYRDTPGARVGIICNTVDRAVALGEALRADGARVIVLHSRMTGAHRAEIGRRIDAAIGAGAQQGDPLIVVGTQTIESSLDVDFDHLLTDLAPAPSLIQRAGRLWRHSAVREGRWEHSRAHRGGEPTVDVAVMMEGDELHRMALIPYQAVEQKRTLRALLHAPVSSLAVPGDVQGFVDASALSDRDLDDTGIASHEIDQNILAIQKRLNQARAVAVTMRREGRSRRGLLDEDLAVHTLAETTRRDAEPGEAQTRFIETEKVTCLLLDPTGQSPWAFHGQPWEARTAARGSAAQRRALLGATVPLSARERRRFGGVSHSESAVEDTGFLSGVLMITLNDASGYDVLTGPVLTP